MAMCFKRSEVRSSSVNGQEEGTLSHFFPVLVLHGDIFGFERYNSGNSYNIFSVSLFSKTLERPTVGRGKNDQ